MNLIQNQTEKFYQYKYTNNYKEFIKELRWELTEYRKDSHKLEFIEHIIHSYLCMGTTLNGKVR